MTSITKWTWNFPIHRERKRHLRNGSRSLLLPDICRLPIEIWSLRIFCFPRIANSKPGTLRKVEPWQKKLWNFRFSSILMAKTNIVFLVLLSHICTSNLRSTRFKARSFPYSLFSLSFSGMTFATFYPPLWHCFHSPGLRLRASKGWPWARWRWTWGGWNSVSAIWWMYTVKKAALKGGSKVSHFVFKACGVLTEYVVTRWYRAPEAGFLFFFVEWLCLFVYAQLLCWPQWKSRCSRWCCCRSSIQPQWTSGLLDSQIFLPGPGSVDSWDFLRLVASLAKFLEGRQGSPEIWQNWPGQLAMLVAWTFTHWHPLTWLNLLCNKLWSNHRPCSLVRTILIWIGPEFFWIENIRHSNLWKIGFFLRAGWGMYGGQGAWKSCWFWSQLASEGEIFVRVVTAGSCRLTCKVLKIWPMAGYWCIPLPAKGILPVGFSGFFSVLPMCFQLMMNENLAGLSSRFWCKLGCARIFPSKFFHLWSTVTFFFNHMFLLEMIYIYISCFNRDSPTASFDVFACFFVMPGFAEGSVAPGALTKLLKKTILRSAVLAIVILPRLGSARAHYSSRSTKTWVPPTTNGRKTTNMLCCCFFGGNPWSWLVFCCFFMFSIMLRLNLQVCEALLSSGATTTSRTLWLDWGGCET